MEKFGKVVVYTLLSFLQLFILAWTLSVLWGWFVVPLGVVAIGGAQAYGLALMSFLLSARRQLQLKSEFLKPETFVASIGRMIGFSLVAVSIGYLTTLFM